MQLLEFTDLDDCGAWPQLWTADAYRHPAYLPAELRAGSARRPSLYYLPAQLRPAAAGAPCGEFMPAHLVAKDAAGPVMGVLLTIERTGGRTYLSAFGRPLYIAEDRHASCGRRRTAARLIYHRLAELCDIHDAENYHFRDFLADGRQSALTELVLRGGGHALPYFTQMIDLAQPAAEILSDFRQSLRNVIRRDRPEYTVEVITASDASQEQVRTFHDLHVSFFGRETRPPAAWDALLDCVRQDQAFLVLGYEKEQCVSAAYFPCSDNYCLYASAVNDRSKYGIGLSHLVVWRAIEHARAKGCSEFELGERLYPGQHAGLDGKYHSISHFKAGFGSRVAVRLDVFSGTSAGERLSS